MTSLSAAVMAHPSRRTMVNQLLDQLDRHVPVSWDVEGPPSPDKEKRWRVGTGAWRMHGDSDWHMVIQDDATVCPDLLAGLEEALEYVPDEIGLVQPYVGKARPLGQYFLQLGKQADAVGASWIQHRSLCWGVAIIARTSTIEDMIRWCAQRKTLTYDARVGRYYRDALGQHTWYTWPSLVDHRDGPSLVGHGPGRVANKPHRASALGLSWDGPVIRDRVPVNQRRHPMRPVRPIITRGPF